MWLDLLLSCASPQASEGLVPAPFRENQFISHNPAQRESGSCSPRAAPLGLACPHPLPLSLLPRYSRSHCQDPLPKGGKSF